MDESATADVLQASASNGGPHRGTVLFEDADGMFGRLRVIQTQADGGHAARLLCVDDVIQSACYVEDALAYKPVLEYISRFDLLFAVVPQARRILMVGGGGYSYPEHVLASHPSQGICVDVVEPDPEVTQIARTYFNLDRLIHDIDMEGNNRLCIIEEDGRSYLDRYAERRALGKVQPYDAILMDAFAAGNPVPELADADAARSVKGCLAPGGVFIANVVSAVIGRRSGPVRQAARAWGGVFANVHVVPCMEGSPFTGAYDSLEDPMNCMVIATDAQAFFDDEVFLGCLDGGPAGGGLAREGLASEEPAGGA